MKRLIAVLFIAVMLFCSCGPQEVIPTPTFAPEQTEPPKQDAVSDMLPLHLSRDGALVRVFASHGSIVSVELNRDFSFNYGGKAYEIIKYYRENDLLFFGAEHSVKDGRAYCNLYLYDGEVKLISKDVLSESVVFASDGLAFVKDRELFIRDAQDGKVKSVAYDVDDCLLAGDDIASLVYLSNARLYKNKEPLGECRGEILFASDGVITVKTRELSGGYCDVCVIFANNGKAFKAENVDPSFGYVDGYLLTKNGIVYLDGEAVQSYGDRYAVEVQGGEGIVGFDGSRCTYYFNGQTRLLNIDSLALEAHFVRGRLLVKTERWLYDGSSKIGDPYRVEHIDSDLYMLYKNPDGVTSSIRKLDGAEPVAQSVLADMPIYSVGGKIAYFVRQSFTKEIYRLKIGKDIYIDNVDPFIAPTGNSKLTEILFYRDGYPVLYYGGQLHEFKNCKIYL